MNESNEVGRPLKYQSVEKMQEDIDAYFKECDELKKPYTVSGLAYEFSNTIKSAKAKIECFNEEQLYNKDVPTSGVIFNLKNNYHWQDKQEIEADVKNDVSITVELVD